MVLCVRTRALNMVRSGLDIRVAVINAPSQNEDKWELGLGWNTKPKPSKSAKFQVSFETRNPTSTKIAKIRIGKKPNMRSQEWFQVSWMT